MIYEYKLYQPLTIFILILGLASSIIGLRLITWSAMFLDKLNFKNIHIVTASISFWMVPGFFVQTMFVTVFYTYNMQLIWDISLFLSCATGVSSAGVYCYLNDVSPSVFLNELSKIRKSFKLETKFNVDLNNPDTMSPIPFADGLNPAPD